MVKPLEFGLCFMWHKGNFFGETNRISCCLISKSLDFFVKSFGFTLN